MTNYRSRRKILVLLVLCAGAFLMLFPFFWMIITSLKDYSETTRVPMTFWPDAPSFKNYINVAKVLPWGTLYFNTLVMMAIRVIVSGLFATMAGYAFARLEFPGKKLVFTLILAMMMVPSQVFTIPQYLQVAKMGMLDTVFALAWPGLVSAYSVFLMRQAFSALPKELDESARLDGCGYWRTCWRILVPLTKASIAAMCIITALWAFKDLAWPLVVNMSKTKMTLSSALSALANDGSSKTDYPLLMAGATISIIPMTVLYAVFQKQFVQGVAMSGLK